MSRYCREKALSFPKGKIRRHLQNVNTQYKIEVPMKSNKDVRHLFQVFGTIDDMADNPRLCRNSQLFNGLYMRQIQPHINYYISSDINNIITNNTS